MNGGAKIKWRQETFGWNGPRDLYGFVYCPYLRTWLVEMYSSIKQLDDGRTVKESHGALRLDPSCRNDQTLIFADREDLYSLNLETMISQHLCSHGHDLPNAICSVKDSVYWLSTGGCFRQWSIRQPTIRKIDLTTGLNSSFRIDPIDSTLFWLISDENVIIWDRINATHSILSFSEPIWGIMLTLSGHIVLGCFSKLQWMDRTTGFIESLNYSFRGCSNNSLTVDRANKTLFFGNNDARVVMDGFPVEWFEHPSVLHNTRRMAILIAFIRANFAHPFRFSVLALLRSPLIFSLLDET